MIKLVKISIFSSLLVVFSGLAAQAFLLPPGPVSPTTDAPTDVMFSLRNVSGTAQQYAASAQAAVNSQVQSLKAMAKQYAASFKGFMGGLFKKKEKAAIPGSKTIQKSNIADIYDPESVKKAMYTLFLAYPVDCDKNADNFSACNAYKAKAEEFYQDTVIEIYTSVRLLEQTMAELTAEVENLSTTFSGAGGDGAETGEDENGVWKNAFNAYQTMNSILKFAQELSAMRAQYDAVLFLREQVTPAPYVSKEERNEKEKASKSSANSLDEKIKFASSQPYSHTETLVFGQLGMMQADSSLNKNTAGKSAPAALSTKQIAPLSAVETMAQPVAAQIAPADSSLSKTVSPAALSSSAVSAPSVASASKMDSIKDKLGEIKGKVSSIQNKASAQQAAGTEASSKLGAVKDKLSGIKDVQPVAKASTIEQSAPVKKGFRQRAVIKNDVQPLDRGTALETNKAFKSSVSNLSKTVSPTTFSSASPAVKSASSALSAKQIAPLSAVETMAQPVAAQIAPADSSLSKRVSQAALSSSAVSATAKAVPAAASAVKQAAAVMEDDDEEYVYNPELYSGISFTDAPKPPLKSAFEGNRQKLLELDKIAPLYNKVLDAKEVHNLIQALDSYRDIFENYERYKKLHQKSIEAVAAADQCAVQYLNRHYANPEKVWKGAMPDAAVNDYDARKGISGWAVKAFEVAKSEETTPLEEEDLGTLDINMEVDLNDPDAEKKLQAEIEGSAKSALVNPSKEAEIEQATRDSQMISFNIGAEAAQLLVEDQYKSAPQWGAPSVRFPVWKDQINFYTQYIDGKYANIKDYLHQYDVSSVIVDLAYSLNDLEVADEEERANNRAGLDRLSSRLKRETEVSDPARVLKELQDNRSKMMAQTLQRKDTLLSSLKSQKKNLLQQMDRASAVLSGNNEQLNTVRQKKLEADTGIAVKEQQIEYLTERRGEDEDNLIRKTEVEYKEKTFELAPEKVEQVHSISRSTTTQKKQLFDTDEAISDYNEKIKKLQYDVQHQNVVEAAENKNEATRKQLMPVKTDSNQNGSLSLYPEKSTAVQNGKKSLFRRPFSDNSDFAPLNTPKYSLSQTLYFGAEYPSVRQLPVQVSAVQNKASAQQATSTETASKLGAAKDKLSGIKGNINTGLVKRIDFQSEKNKLDAELDEKIANQAESKVINETMEVKENTVAAVETTYTEKVVTEKMEVNKEDTEDMALAKVQMAENFKDSKENKLKAAKLKAVSVQKEQEVDSLKRQVEKSDEQKKAVEADYVAQIQQIEQAYNRKREEAEKYIESKRQAKETLDLINYYQEKIGLPVANAEGVFPPFSLLNILQKATDLTNDTKNYADQLISDAHKSILQLGDGVYVGEYGDKIQEIHVKLMEQLQSLPVDGLRSFSSAVGTYAQTASIIKPLTSLFQKLMIEQACANDSCKQIDNEYFVGSFAKQRDFMVPKAAPQEYLPPLREVVHFDDVDYENVTKSTDGGVAGESFLNSGARMPEIWKRILDDKAFVEKGVDLKALLAEGGETPSFMRGGRYPCRLDDQIIDIDNVDGQFKVYTSKALPSKATAEEKAYRPAQMYKMPQCNEINLKSSGGLLGKLYVTVEDKVEEVTAPAAVEAFQAFSGNTPHSELGTFLRAADQGLFFNEAPETVFARLSKMADEAGQSNSSYKKNMQDEVYQKALLNKNQFGNFLTFVEQEISYRQALEELKLSVDEAKETLFEQLKKAGFTPSADYNLARQEDYDLTKDTLNRRKNTLVNEGFNEMEAVQAADNEVVEERLSKIRNILTALRKDKNAYISLSDVTDSGASLDESIKAEELNHQVTAEYKKRADEEFEKQIKSYPIPFCAAY